MIHYTHPYLINPVHQVTVDIVGMGGNGSQVLTGLGRMHQALLQLGHPGLFITAWDTDIVTEANMGRQLFSPADVGMNKAIVLIQRLNRFFGTDWQAQPVKYTGSVTSNILITCVDTAKSRVQIGKKLKWNTPQHPANELYYWLDAGNQQYTGQCVLGTMYRGGKKIKGAKTVLKTVVQLFPQLYKMAANKKADNHGPSCSLAEALTRQDLFINSTLAQFACALLWKLFREGSISIQGCYVNLESMIVNPIKIK